MYRLASIVRSFTVAEARSAPTEITAPPTGNPAAVGGVPDCESPIAMPWVEPSVVPTELGSLFTCTRMKKLLVVRIDQPFAR